MSKDFATKHTKDAKGGRLPGAAMQLTMDNGQRGGVGRSQDIGNTLGSGQVPSTGSTGSLQEAHHKSAQDKFGVEAGGIGP
jgi:hypothetical protein